MLQNRLHATRGAAPAAPLHLVRVVVDVHHDWLAVTPNRVLALELQAGAQTQAGAMQRRPSGRGAREAELQAEGGVP